MAWLLTFVIPWDKRDCAFALLDAGYIAFFLALVLATTGLVIGLARKQGTAAVLAVVAMVLSGASACVLYHFGEQRRDLSRFSAERVGGAEREASTSSTERRRVGGK